MRRVMVLSVLGILSLVAVSWGDRTPPTEAPKPPVPERIPPATAESATEVDDENDVRITRAGPRRHLLKKKQEVPVQEPDAVAEKALREFVDQVIPSDASTQTREHRYYSRAGPWKNKKAKDLVQAPPVRKD